MALGSNGLRACLALTVMLLTTSTLSIVNAQNSWRSAALSAAQAAQQAVSMTQQSVVQSPYYLVMFSPGVGCMLWSTLDRDGISAVEGGTQFTVASLVAATATGASRVTTGSFTCTFRSTDGVADPALAQQVAQNQNAPATLWQLPAFNTTLLDNIVCTYPMYSKNVSVTTPEDNLIPIGGLRLYADWQNRPAAASVRPGRLISTLTVTCRINTTLSKTPTSVVAEFPNSACFPEDATVITPRGPVLVSRLGVGSTVLALDAAGRATWDRVILTPHRDTHVMLPYVHLSAGNTTLAISPRHYIPVACGNGRCLRHAENVAVGDRVWLAAKEGEPADLAVVTEV